MLKQITDQSEWNQIVQQSEFNHPLQLWGWGEAKKANGWLPIRVSSEDGAFAAQILLKKLPKLKFYLAYIPRGPLCDAGILKRYLPELKAFLKSKNVLSLRLEPSYTTKEAKELNLKYAKNKILMNKTLQIDLTRDIGEIKSAMSSSTKNNINKSLKNIEVVIHSDIEDFIDQFYRIYSETASRAGFKLQSKSYYQSVLDNMSDNLDIKVAVDKQSGHMISFLWNAFSDSVVVELYAGMDQAYAKIRSNYGIKFRAIEDALNRGNKIYDFGGRLEGGVESFKLSFGPDKVDYVKTLQLNLSPLSGLADLAESLARKI
jgi:peptidoglycan pentaglycine glycine transferase (the first glycine)